MLARQFQGDLTRPLTDVAGKVGDVVHLALAQFGLLVILVPSGFLLAVIRHPRYALLSGVAVLTTCFFASSYENAAIERYYVGPVFFSWTWLAILGGAVVDAVMARLEPDEEPSRTRSPKGRRIPRRRHRPARRRATAARDEPLGPSSPWAWGSRCWSRPSPSSPSAGGLRTMSHQTWVHRWLDEAFTALEPNALVLSWWSYSTPLWYGQLVEHRRPDVSVVDDRTRLDEHLGSLQDVIEANLDTRPVYLIRLSPIEIEALSERYVIENARDPGQPVPGRPAARSQHDRRPRPGRDPRARPGPRASAVLLLPGPQRGGQPRGAGARGARGPAGDRRPVRDHRRRRRLEGPDARDRRAARRRAPGRRAGRPPRGQPRLRGRPAVGLRGVPLRAPRVHRRRPPVPRRGPRPADGPPRPGRPARTWSWATGSSAPTP